MFVNGKEIVKVKTKDSAIVAAPLRLGNISEDWSVENMKRTGLNGYVYEFSVGYRHFDNPVDAVNSVSLLHKYFMTKYNIK